MNPVDYGIIAVIVLIIAFSIFCIYRSRKSGKKCIGCPDSGSCSGSCDRCVCHCSEQK